MKRWRQLAYASLNFTFSRSSNDNQLILSLLFLGFGLGQFFYGPLSDTAGRKPAAYIGLALFTAGCLLALLARSFPLMLAGRFLQGVGVAGPRTITLALVRDRFEGREMARVMSLIMAVFILVPIVAPALGQAILGISGWRAIFGFYLAMGLVASVWFALRQEETLPGSRGISPLYRSPLCVNVVTKEIYVGAP